MGAPVEGYSIEQITKKYGLVKEMLPYAHYNNNERGGGRLRVPGTTEDGIERQKLICTAIIEKKGRIDAQDLAKIWVRDINPDNFGVQLQPTDEILYRFLKAGIGINIAGYQKIGHYSFFPAIEAGRYNVATGTVAFARSCQPIGIINAYDPKQAAQDAIELGKMHMASNDVGLFWGAAVAASIADAFKPNADIDSMIRIVEGVVPPQVWDEINEGINIAKACDDVLSMREIFNGIYTNTAGFNPMSKAHEIITKGYAILHKTRGNTKDAIIAAVNFGRDTDCLAAVVGGLSGALTGTMNIPNEWIATVDQATSINEYTVSKLSLEQTSRGLLSALKNQLRYQKSRIMYFETMEDEKT